MNGYLDFPEAFQELFRPHRYKVFYGGRGSGKSWAVARALILISLQKDHRILCAREFQASIKDSAKALLGDQIEAMGLSPFFRITREEIRCTANKSRFVFHGLKDAEKIKSLEGITICWVEEANTISKQSMDFLIPTIRYDGSEIWFTFNPHNEYDPVYKMFVKSAPRENAYVRQVNFDENPWFPDTLKQEMLYDKQHDNDKYQHVWQGKTITHSKASIFTNWRIDGSIAPGPDEPLYYGADWGFAVDPTTLLRCWADHKLRILYFDYEAYGVGVEIDETPELFDSVPGSRDWKITADSARPETISYMKRQGFRMVGVKKTPGSVLEGVKFLQSYTIIVHDRCKNMKSELGLYKYKVDKLTGEILPIIVDKHNHMIDAARYSLNKLIFKKKQIHIS